MIKFYYTPGTSSRKARDWLIKNNLEFKEINWKTRDMSREDFNKILSLTESGLQDIISKRSIAYPSFSKKLITLSLSEIFIFLHCEKSLLRLPLIVDENHLQIGYNTENIRQFIPRENREIKRRIK